MSSDNERPVLGQNLIGSQDVSRRAHLTATKSVFRHAQHEKEVLHHAHRRAFREDCQNVKPELRREFETREDQNPSEQAPVFGKTFRFMRLLPAEVFEQLQILDLAPEVSVTSDGVVIGQGDGIETPLFSPAQNVEDADPWLLVVGRSRGVDVKIDAAPREILRKSYVIDNGFAGC